MSKPAWMLRAKEAQKKYACTEALPKTSLNCREDISKPAWMVKLAQKNKAVYNDGQGNMSMDGTTTEGQETGLQISCKETKSETKFDFDQYHSDDENENFEKVKSDVKSEPAFFDYDEFNPTAFTSGTTCATKTACTTKSVLNYHKENSKDMFTDLTRTKYQSTTLNEFNNYEEKKWDASPVRYEYDCYLADYFPTETEFDPNSEYAPSNQGDAIYKERNCNEYHYNNDGAVFDEKNECHRQKESGQYNSDYTDSKRDIRKSNISIVDTATNKLTLDDHEGTSAPSLMIKPAGKSRAGYNDGNTNPSTHSSNTEGRPKTIDIHHSCEGAKCDIYQEQHGSNENQQVLEEASSFHNTELDQYYSGENDPKGTISITNNLNTACANTKESSSDGTSKPKWMIKLAQKNRALYCDEIRNMPNKDTNIEMESTKIVMHDIGKCHDYDSDFDNESVVDVNLQKKTAIQQPDLNDDCSIFSKGNNNDLIDTTAIMKQNDISECITINHESNNDERPIDKIDCSLMTGTVSIEHIDNWSFSATFQSTFPAISVPYHPSILLPKDEAIYYEVRLVTKCEVCQIGWAKLDDFYPSCYNGQGVGDDDCSYGYDGGRCVKFFNGNDKDYGSAWSPEDIIGCMYHPSKGEISYFINGHSLGIAFNVEPNIRLSPAISCGENERIVFVAHVAALRYSPPSGCLPLQYMLTTNPEIEKDLEVSIKKTDNDVEGLTASANTMHKDSWKMQAEGKVAKQAHKFSEKFLTKPIVLRGGPKMSRQFNPRSSKPSEQYKSIVTPQPTKTNNTKPLEPLESSTKIQYVEPKKAEEAWTAATSKAISTILQNLPQNEKDKFASASLESRPDPPEQVEQIPKMFLPDPPEQMPDLSTVSKTTTKPCTRDLNQLNTEPSKPKKFASEAAKETNLPIKSSPFHAQLIDNIKISIPKGKIKSMTLSGSVQFDEKSNSTLATFADFSTIAMQYAPRAELPISNKAVYYEVLVVTGSLCQLGWADLTRFQPANDIRIGAGDDEYSWSYDGSRKEKYHCGEAQDYGMLWHHGDVVGCKFHPNRGQLSFSLNGIDMGVAFRVKQGQALCPVITCDKDEVVEIKTHRNDLEYLPRDSTPLYDIINPNSNEIANERSTALQLVRASNLFMSSEALKSTKDVVQRTGDAKMEGKMSAIFDSYGTMVLECCTEKILPMDAAIYYEVSVGSCRSSAKLGWADLKPFQAFAGTSGAGDNQFSWSYGGKQSHKYHNGKAERYGKVWNTGDIIGCKFNPSKGQIAYTLNGIDMGVAFNVEKKQRLCPVITCDANETVKFSIRGEDFKYFPSNSIPLYEVIAKSLETDKSESSSVYREPLLINTLSGNMKLEEKTPLTSIAFLTDYTTCALLYPPRTKLPKDKAVYYELSLVTGKFAQIGWAKMKKFEPNCENAMGSGDDKYSWSYDGSRSEIFHDGEEYEYGKFWKAGDVLGCKFYSGRGEISYSLNGHDMGVAFELKCNKKLCPVITCNEGEILNIITHEKDLKFLPEDSVPFHDVLLQGELPAVAEESSKGYQYKYMKKDEFKEKSEDDNISILDDVSATMTHAQSTFIDNNEAYKRHSTTSKSALKDEGISMPPPMPSFVSPYSVLESKTLEKSVDLNVNEGELREKGNGNEDQHTMPENREEYEGDQQDKEKELMEYAVENFLEDDSLDFILEESFSLADALGRR